MPAKLGSKARGWKKRALLKVHGPWCWLCALPGEPAALTIDHVRPLSLGGGHGFANLRLAHRRCNQRRSSGPPGELLLTAAHRLRGGDRRGNGAAERGANEA
jgi:5-methylcytosine-specific restriction endonuclease McrA